MNDDVKCPWCKEKTVLEVCIVEKENGNIKERRCSGCRKIIAAYLVEEGDFLNTVRKFEN
jgi:hypothetical protein